MNDLRDDELVDHLVTYAVEAQPSAQAQAGARLHELVSSLLTLPIVEDAFGPQPTPGGWAVSVYFLGDRPEHQRRVLTVLATGLLNLPVSVTPMAADQPVRGVHHRRTGRSLVLESFLTGPEAVTGPALTATAAWLGGEDRLHTNVFDTEFPLASPDQLGHFAHRGFDALGYVGVHSSPPDRPRRGAYLMTRPFPYLALAFHDPTAERAALLNAWDDLLALGRDLAPAAFSVWATPQRDWGTLIPGIQGVESGVTLPSASYDQISVVPDLALVRPAAWQMIGPGHRARLAGQELIPRHRPADTEFTAGSITGWLDDNTSDAERADAVHALGPLLLTVGEAVELTRSVTSPHEYTQD